MEQHCHLVVLVGTATRDSGISGELTPRVYIGIWMRDGCDRRTECGREELPHVRGQGQRLRGPGCNGAGTEEKSYPSLRSGAVARRSYPTPKARGSGREDQPHVQGAVAARAQEGLEALFHVEGQEGWR